MPTQEVYMHHTYQSDYDDLNTYLSVQLVIILNVMSFWLPSQALKKPGDIESSGCVLV